MAGVLWRPLFDPDFAQEIATAEEQLERALDAYDANPDKRNANADQRTQIIRRQLRELRSTTAPACDSLDGNHAGGGRGGQSNGRV